MVSGQCKETEQDYNFSLSNKLFSSSPVSELLGGVVLVGLLDKKSGCIICASLVFVADVHRGLIVTVSNTVINIDNHAPDGSVPNPNFC